MRNRYGNEYHFEQINDNTYTIKGELSYWRFGAREGQDQMDMTNLGFVDPSGGPFIQLGDHIGERKIVRIAAEGNIIFEVEGM